LPHSLWTMKQGFLLLPILLFFLSSCQNEKKQVELQAGDLLFQNLDCGDLCEAIETVTEGVDGKDFSHCAMVIEHEGELKVIEAIGSGVQITSIEDFYVRSGDSLETRNITVGRMKDASQDLIEGASNFALSKLGEPYDQVYLLDNGAWYCSELIYESFKAANQGKEVFQLAPMTFKNPQTEEYFPAWLEYYQELGVPIPEGEAGLNPGSISRSNHLKILPET